MDSRSLSLTICIPTYNRGARVFSLVSYLLANVLCKHQGDIEIIVVNNCSTDDTEDLLRGFSEEDVRIINRDVHLHSAESNMFASLQFCRGKYVWFHGDDDIPVPETIDWLMHELSSEDVDMYVFNTQSIDLNGVPISDRTLRLNRHYVDLTGDALVFACGFSYALAGVSNIVFRRSMADLGCVDEITRIQEIYSHVTWLIRCYSAGVTRLCSKFLVYYRNDHPDKTLKHFRQFAIKTGIPDRHVWGIGLASHLKYLVDVGALSYCGVAAIYDGRRDGTRFRLVDEIVMQIFLQVKNYLRNGGDRQYIPREYFSSTREFLYKVDLFLYDTLSILDEFFVVSGKRKCGAMGRFEARRVCAALSSRFERIFHRQLEANHYRAMYVARFMEYTIYRTPCIFVAISDSSLPERSRILSYIDPQEEFPGVLVAHDVRDVEERISITIASSNENLMLAAHSVIPWYEIIRWLRRISDSVNVLSRSQETASELRRQSTEMLRQVSFPIRWAFWRIPFSPFRYGFYLIRKLWDRVHRV